MKMRSTWRKLAIAAAVLGSAGIAQAEYCPPTDHGISMTATPEGAAFGAVGEVRCVVHEDCLESLGLLVFADLPDGTRLLLEATTADGTFKVTTGRVFMGVAEIYMKSDEDASSVFPMSNLHRLTVQLLQGSPTSPGTPLLEAAFVD